MKYKILHIRVDLDVAGAQTVMMNYLRAFKDDSNFELTLLVNGCPKHSVYEQECERNHFRVIYSNYVPWTGFKLLRPLVNWFRCQKYIYRIIRKEKPDIVHTHETNILPYSVLPSLLCGVKVKIHTLHSDPYSFNLYFKTWARISFHLAGFYPICVTEVQAEKAQKRYGINDYRIIKNGIDPSRFRNIDREDVRRELGFSKDDFIIGSVGRFAKVKNYGFLISLFAEYTEVNTNAKLLLVGDGQEKRQLEQLAKNKGVLKKILFTGLRSDVERMYYAMDLFMLTSFFESSSIVTVEAQYAGVRCVVSSTIPENVVVTPRVNRISLAEPTAVWIDAINGLKHHDKLNGNLSDFSVEQSVMELRSLYQTKLGF